jgi:hypothetical protein
MTAPVVPSIHSKLGSFDKNAGATTKDKMHKLKADREKRLADLRGKSKPAPSVSKSTVSDLPALSSSKAFKLGSAKANDVKADRKLQLNAQMREKAKARGTVPLSSTLGTTSKLSKAVKPSSSSVKPAVTGVLTVAATAYSQSKSASKITASPSLVKEMKQLSSQSTAKSAKPSASGSKNKAPAPRPDVLSPMSTYEMSDREQSDTDDSESESYQHRKRKNVPSWAQKAKLLPALERQYGNRDGQLDPETIFPPVMTCNLDDIFDQKKSRYRQRTSSANWSKDGVTHTEIVAYKRTMGY